MYSISFDPEFGISTLKLSNGRVITGLHAVTYKQSLLNLWERVHYERLCIMNDDWAHTNGTFTLGLELGNAQYQIDEMLDSLMECQ